MGMKIIIIENLDMTHGIANGTSGKLINMRYRTNDKGKHMAICTYVHVLGYTIHIPEL